jgi:homoaconitase/3-isopropylmalate dehydratase large subunit
VRYWRTLKSDDDAKFDVELALDAAEIPPMVTWGTSPEQALPVTARVPDPPACPTTESAPASNARSPIWI